MLFTPAILALLGGSLLTGAMVVYAAFLGVRILGRWDLLSGSETQLWLERRTYLVSTFLSYSFLFLLASFFLFIFTAERLHPYFTGAMCAAGSLHANAWGYPALFLKLLNCLGVGLWLVMNHADSHAPDYPLIRVKYRLLLALTPLLVAETLALLRFFWQLRPEIITSCCGALFSTAGTGLTADLLAVPVTPLKIMAMGGLLAVVGTGLLFLRTGRGGYFFAGASLLAFCLAIVSLLGLVAPYVYELPHHRCPFCILKQEYDYVGYPLYLATLAGGISGLSVGVLAPFRQVESLALSLPALQRKLVLTAVMSYGLFAAVAAWRICSSHLMMP